MTNPLQRKQIKTSDRWNEFLEMVFKKGKATAWKGS